MREVDEEHDENQCERVRGNGRACKAANVNWFEKNEKDEDSTEKEQQQAQLRHKFKTLEYYFKDGKIVVAFDLQYMVNVL